MFLPGAHGPRVHGGVGKDRALLGDGRPQSAGPRVNTLACVPVTEPEPSGHPLPVGCWQGGPWNTKAKRAFALLNMRISAVLKDEWVLIF